MSLNAALLEFNSLLVGGRMDYWRSRDVAEVVDREMSAYREFWEEHLRLGDLLYLLNHDACSDPWDAEHTRYLDWVARNL